MNHSWLKSIDNQLIEFIDSLQKQDSEFDYFPAKKGLTKSGKELSLGPSCYSLKTLYTLNCVDRLDEKKKQAWSSYINSFQKSKFNLPTNSYIDDEIYNFYTSLNIKYNLKNKAKIVLNLTGLKEFKPKKTAFQEAIRADTKQAISTLYQIGEKNILPYSDFPTNKEEIFSFLNSLNWKQPWSAGGQLAALSVFIKTQLNGNVAELPISYISEFLTNLIDSDTGLYYQKQIPSESEAINGAMKIITALDWIDHEIHYPEKLIDFCLGTKPSSKGCDLVDIVYVLYKCLLQVDYKRNEVSKYLNDVINLISLHYRKDEGGFSYSIDKSQEYYYGLKISKGTKNADLHGTLLLTWALSMIFYTIEKTEFDWKVIKP